MFRSARLKLTGWYLLIIMLISLLFSVVICKGISSELEVGYRRAELRLRAEELGIKLPRHIPRHLEELRPEFKNMTPRAALLADLQATRRRVILFLLLTNGMILVISGGAAYFLAGKTLEPIEEALEEQKRFVADASHELRTPLTALKASTEVALRDKKLSTKEARKALESNLEDVNSLQILADNLLSLAQYEKGNSDFVFGQVNLAEVIEKAHKKIHPLVKKKNIAVRIGAVDVAFGANEESLGKIMLIFLDNAVKYTPRKGEVVVTAHQDSKHVFIEIRDSGMGINQEDIRHIFDRFYRVDQSRSKTRVLGFGLGLSMAKKIVDLHKGSVDVSSAPGQGTTFTVKLPLTHT